MTITRRWEAMKTKLSAKEQELYRRTDEILHYIWDPIGVSDSPLARDEYYSYLPNVFSQLIKDCKYHEIAAYLVQVESSSMGMSADQTKAAVVAKLLIETKEALLE